MSRSARHSYRVYGLTLLSDLPLPDLHQGSLDEADVSIRLGQVPAADGEGEGLSLGADGAILRIRNIASFLIKGGREIIVEKQPGAADRNVRLYLLGSAMGILLHQKGLLPLHANAIEIDGRAVAFMGESGAGKSTLAASLHDAGHRVIADDVCVLGVEETTGRIQVQPGQPRIRLWKDALQRTGREVNDYEYSYAGDETYEKFDVPVAPERTAEEELDLAAIYLLSSGERFAINRLAGVEAVEAIFSNTYRGFVVSRLGHDRLHFDAAVKIAQSTPIFRLERSRELSDIAFDVSSIEAHARRLIGG